MPRSGCAGGGPEINDACASLSCWEGSMDSLACRDCGTALRRPRREPPPRRCAGCGKRRRNARARLPDGGQEVAHTHWEAASVQRALAAEQARLDALRDEVGRSECEVERLRLRLACLQRRERGADTAGTPWRTDSRAAETGSTADRAAETGLQRRRGPLACCKMAGGPFVDPI